MEEVPVNKVKNIYQKANDSGIENAEDSKYYNLVAQTITDANGNVYDADYKVEDDK